MRKTVILSLVWIVVLVLIVINIIINPGSLFVNGTIIFGWLLFALQLTWNKSERFYMVMKNLWYTVKNPDCIWNMQVELTGYFGEDVFDKIDHVISNECSEYQIITISNIRKLYKVKTLTYEIVVGPQQIRLQVDNLEVSFRRSKIIIHKEIGYLLERLSKVLKEDKGDYYLSVDFKKYNPYFGFFVRRLNANEINTFNVKFNIDDEHVSINKKSIEIHTDSLNRLTSFSKEYLSLSPR